MLQPQTSHRAQKYLTDNFILPELLSDNLSDVPEILSDSESSDSSVRERVIIVHPEQTSSESDETSNEGATSWVKTRQNSKFRTFCRKSRGKTNST
jgi:hypothetical protein